MSDYPLGPSSPIEIQARLAAERRGRPHLLYRREDGAQAIVELDSARERLAVGRGPRSGLHLHWDNDVSQAHAELERLGGVWTVSDDGLSRNGTFLNGIRIGGRQRLRDRDVLRFGDTVVVFRDPASADLTETHTGAPALALPVLSDSQRRVLLALCRPFKAPGQFATPATNQQIADELFLSVEAIKSHLRALFAKFDVADLPQNEKRAKLVERAFQTGAVTEREL